MKYIASECDPDSYADLAFVIALPQWFGEYKREPIYVTKFPGNSYVGFQAVLKDEVSPRYWIDPNGKEHKWFCCERLVPDTKELFGTIHSARLIGNVTAYIKVEISQGTYEKFFCRIPIKAAPEYYSQWVEHRKNHKEKSKVTPTPLLLTSEFHFGGGPIAELARACRGIKQLMEFKGMPVKLTWTNEGVCRIAPRQHLLDQAEDAQ